MSQLKDSQAERERILSYSTFFVLFRASIDKAYPHWGDQFCLLSLLIQLLISSRNTFTDTPRNNV